MFRRAAPGLFMLLLAGCAAGPANPPAASAPAAVQAATAADVGQCAVLPDLVVTAAQPDQTGMIVAQSVDSARRSLLTKARDAGATHVVWGQELVGFGGTVVTARAFRCEQAVVSAAR